MRTSLAPLLSAAVVALPLATFACGGGNGAAGGAATPGNASSSASPSAPDSSAIGPVDGGPSTTTTTTLGSGGDLQGAKLTQTTTVASTTGSSPAPPPGPHTHEPGRSQADLRAIMVAHKPEARACYDAGLASHPGIQGDLVIQLTIDPKGNVTRISEDTGRSQINEPGVVACVVGVVKKIQFAASPGGYETMATFPYNFLPRKAAQPQGQGTSTP
jgi:hypothetical protein